MATTWSCCTSGRSLQQPAEVPEFTREANVSNKDRFSLCRQHANLSSSAFSKQETGLKDELAKDGGASAACSALKLHPLGGEVGKTEPAFVASVAGQIR